jgi:hypothetical protein
VSAGCCSMPPGAVGPFDHASPDCRRGHRCSPALPSDFGAGRRLPDCLRSGGARLGAAENRPAWMPSADYLQVPVDIALLAFGRFSLDVVTAPVVTTIVRSLLARRCRACNPPARRFTLGVSRRQPP